MRHNVLVFAIRGCPTATLRGDVCVLFARISGHFSIDECTKRLDSNVFTDSAFHSDMQFPDMKRTHLEMRGVLRGFGAESASAEREDSVHERMSA